MPKFKVGDLVDFLTGHDWSTKSHTGIIIDVLFVEHRNATIYQCYGQVTQQSYWIEERLIKFVEETWKLFEDEFVER